MNINMGAQPAINSSSLAYTLDHSQGEAKRLSNHSSNQHVGLQAARQVHPLQYTNLSHQWQSKAEVDL